MTPQVPLDSKTDAIKEAKKLKDKGIKIVTIYPVRQPKHQNVYKELEKISTPLKPIVSPYDELDDRVRKVADLLCSCMFIAILW